jgi:hypothetical protein
MEQTLELHPRGEQTMWRDFLRRNLGLVIGFFVAYIAFIFVTISPSKIFNLVGWDIPLRETINIGLAAIFVLLIYRALYFYLNRGTDHVAARSEILRIDPAIRDLVKMTEARLENLTTRIGNTVSESVARHSAKSADLFTNERELAEFKQSIASNIVEAVSANLKKQILEELSSLSKFASADQYQNKTSDRLHGVVAALERRANLNLAAGATIGAVGISALFYLLYWVPPTIRTPPDHTLLALQYFSRVTIVFLIEVFAFFFLKLYSQTLGELRYTHNEISNIQLKAAGLQIAIASGNKTAVSSAADNLIKTERNFILDKGKSTVDLEKARLENESLRDTVRTMFASWGLPAVVGRRQAENKTT